MFNLDLQTLARVTRPLALALAATLCAGSVVHAKVTKPGGHTNKVHPYPVPVHGPGTSHNPIVRVPHGPLHGAGSSHNPIVVPKNCNDPNTVCRRP
jgi:hypothetical protein